MMNVSINEVRGIENRSNRSTLNQWVYRIAMDHYVKETVEPMGKTLEIDVRAYACERYPDNPVEGILSEAKEMTAASDVELLDSFGINTMAIVEQVVRESIREHDKLYDLAMKLGDRLIQSIVDKKEAAGTLSIF